MTNIFIGIDLSFNSTGITIIETLDKTPLKLSFHRLVFDDESNKIKKYVPKYIRNVNQSTYRLPTNILTKDIVMDYSDFYSEDQATITLKAMVCCKRIIDIVSNKIKQFEKFNIYINIEGFIMPSINGIEQFRSLSGLIMLQGMLRSELIKIKLSSTKVENFKLFITSPSDLKKWFTGNGSADKQIMLDNFIEVYNGIKLLPNIHTTKLSQINDVIDSFALCLNSIAKLKELVIVKPKLIKKTKKKKQPKFDIIKNSILQSI